MSDWQDISTAPKDGTTILIAHKHWKKSGIAQYSHRYGWLHYACLTEVRHPSLITHWMPIPEPPKDKP